MPIEQPTTDAVQPTTTEPATPPKGLPGTPPRGLTPQGRWRWWRERPAERAAYLAACDAQSKARRAARTEGRRVTGRAVWAARKAAMAAQ